MAIEREYVRELDGRPPLDPRGFELRPPRPTETGTLYEVYRDAFSTRTSALLDGPTWIAKWPLDPHCALRLSAIALSGTLAIGYLLSDLDDARPGEGTIAQMGVRVEHRRNGVGRGLIAQALDAFAREGLSHARLQVAPDNENAIRLYERLGFRRR